MPFTVTNIHVLLLFIPIVTAWWWPLSLLSLSLSLFFAHWRWQAVAVSLWATPSLASSLSLSLSLSTCWCHCCSASIVVFFYFFTQLILHTPLLFFTFSLYSSPVTLSLRAYISRPKREEGWEQRKKQTLTSTHLNLSTLKSARKLALTLVLGTKTSETHFGQPQYWITTAGRSDVGVSVVWGGRGPGQDSVFSPSPMGPQRLWAEGYSETSAVRREIPAVSSLHLSHPERTTAQRGIGQVDHGGIVLTC